MSKYLSVAEVKANLSECIREVEQGELVFITSDGKPVAALVRTEDLEHLKRLCEAEPEAGLASLAGGWEDSNELVRHLETSSRIGQREVTDLDG